MLKKILRVIFNEILIGLLERRSLVASQKGASELIAENMFRVYFYWIRKKGVIITLVGAAISNAVTRFLFLYF